jgi:hypothetical protein
MNAICVTCGTQFAESAVPPERCPICEDERQYVGFEGQQWTTLEELSKSHHNVFGTEPRPEGAVSIETEPKFGIGQRAFLLQTPQGNLLWDCLSLLDTATIEAMRQHGGLHAIAISHPHYYTTMVEWSRALGNVPIYLHAADRQWVMRPDACIEFWDGETRPLPGGLTLIRCGGHFEGGTVLHWPAGANGRGALLSGDVIQVVPDRRWVSFMRSYPNYIPLSAAAVRQVVSAVEPFRFDRIYGAFRHMTVTQDGKAAVRRSADRYLRAIGASSSTAC